MAWTVGRAEAGSGGSRLGFMMGALTMLVSGPLTAGGIGPWTPYQMMAAGWVGLGAACCVGGWTGDFGEDSRNFQN